MVSADGTANDNYGISVAVSGSLAIVGAPLKSVAMGVVYIYALGSKGWALQEELSEPVFEDYAYFGLSVAINGTLAVVGSPGYESKSGRAYGLVQNGTSWKFQVLESTAASVGAGYGRSVAINGKTAIVGAPLAYESAVQSGTVSTFNWNGTSWVFQTTFAPKDGANGDGFGTSVAVSGTTAIVGAPNKTVTGLANRGAAYLLALNGTTTPTSTELSEPGGGAAGDLFGSSVAINGSSVVVGAPGWSSGRGTAYLYLHSTNWLPVGSLVAGDGAIGDAFGSSVSISGSSVLVGAPSASCLSQGHEGAAYLFTQTASSGWTQTNKITASDGAPGESFGSSVSIDGANSIIGEQGANVGPYGAQGAVYFTP